MCMTTSHRIVPGVVATMKSILQYFKPIQKEEKKEDIALPAPHGPLCSKVLPGAINKANESVYRTLFKQALPVMQINLDPTGVSE